MGEVRLCTQSDSDFIWSAKDLLAHLAGWDETNHKAAAEALDELGWQPDLSKTGAAYWIIKDQWAVLLRSANRQSSL